MKTLLLLMLCFMSFFGKVYSQDSTKTEIMFLTKDNQSVPLYQEIYVGDFEGQGYNSDGITYQHGIITRKEFLLNAPSSGYFEKNKQIVLVSTDDKYYKMKFTVDTKISNQKWLLTPPGKDYYRGQRLIGRGFLGIILSSVTYGVIGTAHYIQMNKYKMDMDQYNFAKGTPLAQNTILPHKPDDLAGWYLIPTLTLNFSIISLVRGRIINSKNRPSVVRVE